MHDDEDIADLKRGPARSGGPRSLPGLLFVLLLAVLAGAFGFGPRLAGSGLRSGQILDSSTGQTGPLALTRQEGGRVAHAPRPVAKPVLSAAGGDDLAGPPAPGLFFATAKTAERPPLEAPLFWQPHLFGQPRAPPGTPSFA